jgi:hypothetical protein
VLPALLFVAGPVPSEAGPPYATDDPEPVDYRHWEVYLASQVEHGDGPWSGTGPHIEVNYGALSNLQLHLITPFEFILPSEGTGRYGYGDTELGVKYRFIQENDWRPMVGVFPLVELSTGSSGNGLGSGETQAFLPVWVQKSFGAWQTYGGGGYWINPGTGNRTGAPRWQPVGGKERSDANVSRWRHDGLGWVRRLWDGDLRGLVHASLLGADHRRARPCGALALGSGAIRDRSGCA